MSRALKFYAMSGDETGKEDACKLSSGKKQTKLFLTRSGSLSPRTKPTGYPQITQIH